MEANFAKRKRKSSDSDSNHSKQKRRKLQKTIKSQLPARNTSVNNKPKIKNKTVTFNMNELAISASVETTKMVKGRQLSDNIDMKQKPENNQINTSDIETKTKTSSKSDKNHRHSVRHKKMLSKRRKKKLTKKGETTGTQKSDVKTEPPKKPEEFSSNWKQLLTVLQKSEPKKMSKPVVKQKFRHPTKGDNKKENVSQNTEKPSQDIWFDDVDDILIPKPTTDTVTDKKKTDPLVKLGSFTGPTKVVSMDCEMVGVGRDGKEDMLARVSVVNQHGHCIYDQHVKPMEHVMDYRTHVSGVRKEDLEKGIEFSVVQKDVADILKNRILVGHAIHNDMKVLYLSHPKRHIRDTSRYKPFRTLFNGRIPSLKKLTAQVLSVKVQEGEHDSVQDAQAAMRLYTMYRKQWEKDIKTGQFHKKKK